MPVKETSNAKPKTRIAAINDGTARYLIYQSSTKEQVGKKIFEKCSIIVRNIETLESETAVIPNSKNIIDTSLVQIAAVYTTSEAGNRIYVYHTDKESRVYRSYANVTGQGLSFTSSKPLEPELIIQDYATLSVLAGDGKNIIYTATCDSPEVTFIEDDWN